MPSCSGSSPSATSSIAPETDAGARQETTSPAAADRRISSVAPSVALKHSSSPAEQAALNDLAELQDIERTLFVDYSTSIFDAATKRLWSYALGISAFVELLSFVIPYFFLRNVDEVAELQDELRPRLLFFLPRRRYRAAAEVALEDESRSAARWLDDSCYPLGVAFNCLWTVHSFVVATGVRRAAKRGLEKKILLRGAGGGVDGKDGDAKFGEVAGDTAAGGRKRRIRALREEVSMRVYAVGGSWGVFCVMLAWMLLLLPVGFFIRGAHELQTYAGMDISVESALDEETMEKLHVMTKKTKYCLGYAALLRCYAVLSIAATAAVQEKKRVLTRELAKFLAKFAIRRPVTFRRRLRKTLTALRWIKYLAPLIGTGNKLIGQLKTLRKQHQQNKEAQKATKIKKMLWRELAPEDRRETAAVMLQDNYRGYKSRRAYKAMLKVRAKRREAAVIRIQAILRQKAARARTNVLLKKQELRTLQMQQYGATRIRSKVQKLDVEAKRRLYQLEEELASEVEDLKWRKMLLRPNTSFAVNWRVLFVVCVILEITHLALEPRVAQHRDAATGKRLNVGMVLEHYLVPDPITEWPQCEGAHLKRPLDKEETKRRSRKMGKKKSRDNAAPPPWFCYPPCSRIQESFVYFLRYLIKDLLIIISAICFMDVFVTFFTGEICSETGTLLPKPFMKRWLLPGLMLQVLVNPKMAEISAAIKRLWAGIHHIGPARVWRWTVVLIEPAFFAFYGWYERNIWTRMVVTENAKAEPVE